VVDITLARRRQPPGHADGGDGDDEDERQQPVFALS
jgi:hypothetical protein